MPKVSLPSFNIEPIANSNLLLTRSWVRFFQDVWERIGGGKDYNLGGSLSLDTTTSGNTGPGEDDLITYTLLANTLIKANDSLDIVAFGSFAANANNKRVKLIIGSTTVFDTTALAFNGTDWSLQCSLIRITATTQKVIVRFSGDTALLSATAIFTDLTEDSTIDLTIKCTGEGTADDDIEQKGLIVRFFQGA